MEKILIIDDDIDMCLLLNRFLTHNGYWVSEVYSGAQALEYFETNEPDLIISDLKLEDIDGITLLKKIQDRFTNLPIIIITAYNDIQTSVNAIKQGAFDYVTKPIVTEEILNIIELALTQKQENKKKIKEGEKIVVKAKESFFGGSSAFFKRLNHQINLVAPTNHNVIIYGEDGAGKETIAYEIHQRSKRRDGPFVVMNCGGISEELAEAKLFGNEMDNGINSLRNQRIGNLETANGGTLFIDEITSLPLLLQAKLLKALVSKRMRRIGGEKDIELDVRILIAGNETLWTATVQGKLLPDLYHLLNDFTIDILPLYKRPEDILPFAAHFLQYANTEHEKNIQGFTPEVESTFRQYRWPGNLREMKNVVNKAVLLTKDSLIELQSLPVEVYAINKVGEVYHSNL
ncbi:rteB, two-component system response regulator [Russula earlei]|uniref:RteB, two-component system response regulator n=1 Tax=Russula earlei TaxID=71964 RepID=A0ACC0TRJ4_9AGAM|nr:rteB, two-component system response regulator [Russula earlei]